MTPADCRDLLLVGFFAGVAVACSVVEFVLRRAQQ